MTQIAEAVLDSGAAALEVNGREAAETEAGPPRKTARRKPGRTRKAATKLNGAAAHAWFSEF